MWGVEEDCEAKEFRTQNCLELIQGIPPLYFDNEESLKDYKQWRDVSFVH